MKSPHPHGYQIESAWSLVALTELVYKWRERAAYSDNETYRAVSETLARELDAVLQETFDEEISVEQLAQFSGRSVREIRELVEGGLIPNLGTPGRLRVRRRELFAGAEAVGSEGRLFGLLLEKLLAEPSR